MPASDTGAWARPTRITCKPWVILVFARYSSASSCLRSPAGQSITGMPSAFAHPRRRRLKRPAMRIRWLLSSVSSDPLRARHHKRNPPGSCPSGNTHSRHPFHHASAGFSFAPEPDRAQLAVLDLWKQKQRVRRRLLAYDTTNFYTYIASNHTRNELAQRGHSQQGRHNLRQVRLSYVLDGENGLSLCHLVYRGNVADAEEFSTSLARMLGMLDRCQIESQDGRWRLPFEFDTAA
jgi:hypothetical protein